MVNSKGGSMNNNESHVYNVKTGLSEMLKGGVIMDVVTPEQACIAEQAGAIAVMCLEKVPSDIRKEGKIARMSAPELIQQIKQIVKIPVMAKCRIGHILEAKILEELEVDFIDESEVLTPADEQYHIDKSQFKIPFVCGATNLAEALRRIGEGAALIRTKGEAGTGNIVEGIRHLRQIRSEIKNIVSMENEQLISEAKNTGAPFELLKLTKNLGKLPVPNFAAGGIATPADAALVRHLGAEAIFVGSGIFKSENPEKFARSIVMATTFFDDPSVVLKASSELGAAMAGLDMRKLDSAELFSQRGW